MLGAPANENYAGIYICVYVAGRTLGLRRNLQNVMTTPARLPSFDSSFSLSLNVRMHTQNSSSYTKHTSAEHLRRLVVHGLA